MTEILWKTTIIKDFARQHNIVLPDEFVTFEIDDTDIINNIYENNNFTYSNNLLFNNNLNIIKFENFNDINYVKKKLNRPAIFITYCVEFKIKLPHLHNEYKYYMESKGITEVIIKNSFQRNSKLTFK